MADDFDGSGDLSSVQADSLPASETAQAEQPATPVEQQVPYTRFKEVNDGYRLAREEAAQIKAERDLLNRQIQALTGVKPEPQVDPQQQAILAGLEKVIPGISRFGNLPIDRLLEIAERFPELQKQTEDERAKQQEARLSTLAETARATLFDQAKPLYDGKALTEGQQKMLVLTFAGWLDSDQALKSRYLAGDGHLVPEFLKAFAPTMLDPVRRQAAVALDQRTARTATAPTGGGSHPVSSVPGAPKGLDAAIDSAADALFARR